MGISCHIIQIVALFEYDFSKIWKGVLLALNYIVKLYSKCTQVMLIYAVDVSRVNMAPDSVRISTMRQHASCAHVFTPHFAEIKTKENLNFTAYFVHF